MINIPTKLKYKHTEREHKRVGVCIVLPTNKKLRLSTFRKQLLIDKLIIPHDAILKTGNIKIYMSHKMIIKHTNIVAKFVKFLFDKTKKQSFISYCNLTDIFYADAKQRIIAGKIEK